MRVSQVSSEAETRQAWAQLVERGVASTTQLEDATQVVTIRLAAMESARSAVNMATSARDRADAVLIGPEAEHWDHLFVARYPSAHAFLAMVKDPDYAVAVVHRQAAVLTSRLIRTAPAATGKAFA
jgi:hypothetical protein